MMSHRICVRASLFTLFINDLDNGIEIHVSKFSDDTKLGSIVDSVDDNIKLQREIDRLGEWTRLGQMDLNLSKCEVTHSRL